MNITSVLVNFFLQVAFVVAMSIAFIAVVYMVLYCVEYYKANFSKKTTKLFGGFRKKRYLCNVKRK